jgi:hypothetical protein
MRRLLGIGLLLAGCSGGGTADAGTQADAAADGPATPCDGPATSANMARGVVATDGGLATSVYDPFGSNSFVTCAVSATDAFAYECSGSGGGSGVRLTLALVSRDWNAVAGGTTLSGGAELRISGVFTLVNGDTADVPEPFPHPGITLEVQGVAGRERSVVLRGRMCSADRRESIHFNALVFNLPPIASP